MGIQIDKVKALAVLLEEARLEEQGVDVPSDWQRRIEELSEACEASSKTHIALLGTALLAKATNIAANAFAVKEGAALKGAYSARGLGHGVLVPRAPALGIHLGVTGREPLNNQPYFRVRSATLEELVPLVRGHAEAPVRLLVGCLTELEKLTTNKKARAALRAFIRVRRGYRPAYPTAPEVPPVVTPPVLASLVEKVVRADTEGGKRAQAIAAGVLDAVAGESLVLVARINDPDRHFPGDVGVLEALDSEKLTYALEVRDKRVSAEDITMFGKKLAEMGVSRGGVLAVSADQPPLDTRGAEEWASKQGVHLVTFFGWKDFLEQAFFWARHDASNVCDEAYRRVRVRLHELEVTPAAVVMWDAG